MSSDSEYEREDNTDSSNSSDSEIEIKINKRNGPAPLRVLVTGAAGQIAYSLVYPIANGDVFGRSQPVILHLLDIPNEQMMTALNGVVMELEDCSLPLLHGVVATDQESVAFKDIDVAILVGAMPRRDGMERKDLLAANVKIFKSQGIALDQFAKKSVRVLVVGNPANTNCYVAAKFAPTIPPANFSCLTRLDHNRALIQVALKLNITADHVKNTIIWGNHSSTQFPDLRHAHVHLDNDQVKPAYEAINDEYWIKNKFIPIVQKRGAAIIKDRKQPSAMSTAKAICDHLKDWWLGTNDDEWVSMGVVSDGSYGIKEGLVYSFPVHIKNMQWSIVKDLTIDDWENGLMQATMIELDDEMALASENF